MTDKAENTQREQKAKTFRVLQVARLIRTLPYPNITRLAKETGASKRTIARDLDTLRDDYCAPIEYDYFHKGFYYTDDNFDAQKIIMAESELIAIAGLLPMLERYKNTPLEDAIKNAIHLSAICCQNKFKYSQIFSQTFSSSLKQYPKLNRMFFLQSSKQ